MVAEADYLVLVLPDVHATLPGTSRGPIAQEFLKARGTVNLPHGTGKSRKVAVFAKGDKAEAAKAAGAEEVGAEDLIERIQKGWTGWTEFDLLVATPDMMPLVGRLGSVLKQKMPNPKAGTVSANIEQVVKDIKGASRVEFRVEKAGIVHAPIGKASFTQEQLQENFNTFVSALVKAKPQAAKGRYLVRMTVSSSMGPGVCTALCAGMRANASARCAFSRSIVSRSAMTSG